ncbi:MAG: P-type Ca2+ transporter type [Patescibacteria group bacterium]|nr:P-type Ca2+ transporter type [Patescibacteria group bacterium]
MLKYLDMDMQQIKGLSTRDVDNRLKKFGYNELPNKNKKNFFKIVVGLITEPMIFLLLVTVCIYFILGDKNEAVLLLISFFGIISIELYQESKTEKSLEALRNLSSPTCDVIRNSKQITIPGREVVVGDIVILSEGSRVSADARLISAESLEIDESLLTGESVAVEKHINNDDNKANLVFSGTLVIKGHGIAEVTNIGQNTEIGEIGKSLKSINIEKTLLQRDVNKVVKLVAILAILSSLFLVFIYWLQSGNFIKGMLAGLTLAIAILPEEFPVVLAIFLTLGAWRLAKINVLARKSQTIETLGSTTVLCVDKTGTLTENRMKIINVIDANGVFYSDFNETSELIEYGVLASQKNPFDPMEEAFIEAGQQVFNDIGDIYKRRVIVKEYPLEEDALSVVHAWGNGTHIKVVALKGAPEAVFKLCNLDNDRRHKLKTEIKRLATKGLRVIAVAKGKATNFIPDSREEFEFEFLGLVGLADPIRKEVPSAIKLCKEAGVRVVMITGDYPETAMSIAESIGLSCDNAITGAEFGRLSKRKEKEIIKNISVFSRVTPSDKLTIVDAFKKAGEVVAMTGDGVNDAPALKAANVGVAMGKRGTDVAREAASIVLLDDNFTSIVNGISLGRRIYDNLQKAMSYIISIHIPIALLSLLPVIFKWPLVLTPIHIVFLELVIDPSCTIIFENEKASSDIMKRQPRGLNSSIFNRKMVISSLMQGLMMAVFVVFSFGLLLDIGWENDKARGMTFLILIIANILLVLSISGKQALANIIHHENIAMLAILSITSISLLIVFNLPMLRDLFQFGQLSLTEVLVGVLVGAISVVGTIPFRALIKRTVKS